MNNTILYALTVLIWGSTWYAIEFQLGAVAPEVSLVYRYAAAAALLFAWCLFRGLKLRFAIRDHAHFMLLGLLLFGVNYVVAYHAQVHITSALTAIAFSTMVWMNILNARLFFGARSGRRVLIGASLGVIGILVLFIPRIGQLSLDDSMVLGSLLAIASAALASLGNMVSQAAQRASLPVLQSNAWGMFYGTLINATIALASGKEFLFDASPAYIGSLAYLTVFGSIVAFGAYLTLLGRIGAHRAGYAMVLFPVVALVLSAAFEGLSIDPPTAVGCCLVLAGNACVLSRFERSRRLPRLSHALARFVARLRPVSERPC
ncbi:MAG TPA: EamA family transporter [Woeseiaceae bacterium]